MPAIITHDFFGRDTYADLCNAALLSSSQDCKDAYLLGNQGPDPLFYLGALPTMAKHYDIGSLMHRVKTNELLLAMKQALQIIDSGEEDERIARAYAQGFLGHFLLDSTVHPLVYAQQYEICDAGLPDLTRKDGNEVHALIEAEFDEMMLYTNTGMTTKTFNCGKQILKADKHVLEVISRMYSYVMIVVFGRLIPRRAFSDGVGTYRTFMKLIHSKSGLKRQALGSIEELIRHYSYCKATCIRDIELRESTYENREHRTWKNPFTQEADNRSFRDLYDSAKEKLIAFGPLFGSEGFSLEDAKTIVNGINFNGTPLDAKGAPIMNA